MKTCTFRLTPFALFLTVFFATSLFAWPPGGIPVCTDTATQGGPCIAKTTDGFVVGWTDARPGLFTDIYAQKLNGNGVPFWNLNGVVVCDQESTQCYSIVSPGLYGSSIFLWYDYRYLMPPPQNPFLFGQRLDNGGLRRWGSSGFLIGSGPGGSLDPVMLSDDSGGFFVAFLDVTQPPYDDFFPVAGRRDSTGTLLWSKVLSQRYPFSSYLRITLDGQGGLLATWATTLLTDSMFIQRLTSTGQELLPRGGVGYGRSIGYNKALVSDADHGAIAVWESNPYGGLDIYAQRISGTGVVRWPITGLPVRVALGDQANPKAVPDGACGAIIVWEDGASGLRDIYAQRVDSTGARLWDTLGVPVIRSTGDQTGIQLVSDDAGGVIVTWKDNRNGNNDIYAQRLNPNGQCLWDTLGVQVCVWSGEQTVPVMCQDGASGAVIAWQDTRNGNNDIYAHRITASGSGVSEEPAPSRLAPNAFPLTAFPNPFISFSRITGHERDRFTLFDISGRRVGTYKGDRIGEGLRAGVYFVRAIEGKTGLARVVKIR